MTLDHIAAILLGLAALGGLVLAVMHFRNKHVPLALALAHGGAAAPGVAVVVYANLLREDRTDEMTVAMYLLLFAAIAGLTMFFRHGRRRRIPRPLIVLHGSIALIAYVLVLMAAFG